MANHNNQQHDEIEKSAHYNTYPVECLEVVRGLPFEAGNAIKYLWREGHKSEADDEKDRKKAFRYTRDMLTHRSESCHFGLNIPHRLRLLALLVADMPVQTYATIKDILLATDGCDVAHGRLARQLEADGYLPEGVTAELMEVGGRYEKTRDVELPCE